MSITWKKSRITISELIGFKLARDFFRVSAQDQDDLIAWFISGAANTVETDSRYVVKPATFTAKLSANTRSVALPAGPFFADSAELYWLDSEGTKTAVDGDIEHDDGNPGCLSLPEVTDVHDSLEISYQAGSTPLADDVALLVLSLASHRYEHREAATAGGVVKTVPIGYEHGIRGLDPLADGVSF